MFQFLSTHNIFRKESQIHPLYACKFSLDTGNSVIICMKWEKSVLIHKWFQIKYSSYVLQTAVFHQYYSKTHLLSLFSIFIHSKAVVLLLLTFWLLLLPLLESVIVLCFVVRYFMSILVLQLSWWGRESWLLCLICLLGVSWWLSGSSSQCLGVVCSLWLWYFMVILTYYL